MKTFTSTRPEDQWRLKKEKYPSLSDGLLAVIGCRLGLVTLSVQPKDFCGLNIKRYPSHKDKCVGVVGCSLAIRFHLVAT